MSAKVTRRHVADNVATATLEAFVEHSDPHRVGFLTITVDGQHVRADVPDGPAWRGTLDDLAGLFRNADVFRRAQQEHTEADEALHWARYAAAEAAQAKANAERYVANGTCPTCEQRGGGEHVVPLRAVRP